MANISGFSAKTPGADIKNLNLTVSSFKRKTSNALKKGKKFDPKLVAELDRIIEMETAIRKAIFRGKTKNNKPYNIGGNPTLIQQFNKLRLEVIKLTKAREQRRSREVQIEEGRKEVEKERETSRKALEEIAKKEKKDFKAIEKSPLSSAEKLREKAAAKLRWEKARWAIRKGKLINIHKIRTWHFTGIHGIHLIKSRSQRMRRF